MGISMNKEVIIANTIKKLTKLNDSEISVFLERLKPISDDPRKVIMLVQRFEDEKRMSKIEKQQLLHEIKKKGLIKIERPNMDRVWRLILKNWGLTNYRLWS